MTLLEPKPLSLPTQSGEVKNYVLHKFDAITGREIIAKYPVANLPKLGEYGVSEDVMFKLMAFVAVETAPGTLVPLNTRALIVNHVPDWEVLARLEWAMLEYNCSFFGNGQTSAFFENIGAKAPQWISRMLTALSEQSSGADKQPSMN